MNIFVARLNYSTTSDTLRDTFQQFGEVETAKIIFDRETGRSKGYGFVEMPNDDEGNNAIQGLDSSTLDGKQILVKKSEPRGGGDGGFKPRRRF